MTTVLLPLFGLGLGKGFAYEIHCTRDGKVSIGFSYTTSLSGIGDFVQNKETILDFLEGGSQ